MPLILGDCLEVLAAMESQSIDAIVTDPPYDLTSGKRGGSGDASMNMNSPAGRSRIGTGGGFMGLAWDGTGIAFRVELWAEVLRVLKPGAHLLAFGGTRTFHRMACAIEDAGFEIRDSIAWLYGQGFPKSLNLGDGLGTALKPAFEPIVLARKPFKGSVRGNVEAYGTGALNIDACRIGYDIRVSGGMSSLGVMHDDNWRPRDLDDKEVSGRWPANVCLDDLAAMVLDEQSGATGSQGEPRIAQCKRDKGWCNNSPGPGVDAIDNFGDSGGASRFFYVAKPSREERDYGCEGIAHKSAGDCTGRIDGSDGLKSPRAGAGRTSGSRNHHPTVKPVELMRWLVRLVTPMGGTVLDPFMGSGTTGMAARYEQRQFIGIEREADYIVIAEARIASVAPLFAVESCEPAQGIDSAD